MPTPLIDIASGKPSLITPTTINCLEQTISSLFTPSSEAVQIPAVRDKVNFNPGTQDLTADFEEILLLVKKSDEGENKKTNQE